MTGLEIGTDVCETDEPVDKCERRIDRGQAVHPRIPQGFHN